MADIAAILESIKRYDSNISKLIFTTQHCVLFAFDEKWVVFFLTFRRKQVLKVHWLVMKLVNPLDVLLF